MPHSISWGRLIPPESRVLAVVGGPDPKQHRCAHTELYLKLVSRICISAETSQPKLWQKQFRIIFPIDSPVTISYNGIAYLYGE